MPRRRAQAFVLVLFISLVVLSYIHFDADVKAVTHNNPPTILLVSAFFPLSNSKHTISDYEEWLSRFLQPITTPIAQLQQALANLPANSDPGNTPLTEEQENRIRSALDGQKGLKGLPISC